jgi:ubiquinone/menaquinone biosynthesis C-methylase UbiE
VLLNSLEYALMNNPIRAVVQRRIEAERLLRLGGPVRGIALEIGCGQGVGAQLILDVFGADRVDAFDLDPRMIARAQARVATHEARACLWVGDVTHIPVPDESYDAVFDFGIIHHVPEWPQAVAEVSRVLRPGGRFYAEEVLRPFIVHPLMRRLLMHPSHDRFDRAQFTEALRAVGLEPLASESVGEVFAWVVAERQAVLRVRAPAT